MRIFVRVAHFSPKMRRFREIFKQIKKYLTTKLSQGMTAIIQNCRKKRRGVLLQKCSFCLFKNFTIANKQLTF